MSGHDGGYDQGPRDAEATVPAEPVRPAIDAGTPGFGGDVEPEGAGRLPASLPEDVDLDLDLTTVPTSVRLPYPVHQRLRAYAEQHGTTASTLIRQWVEQMLAMPDRPISLADAVRALSALPPQDQHRAV